MGYYVYYSKGTNHNKADDVAVVWALTQGIAKKKFKKYYKDVSDLKIQKIQLNRKGIHIISEY